MPVVTFGIQTRKETLRRNGDRTCRHLSPPHFPQPQRVMLIIHPGTRTLMAWRGGLETYHQLAHASP